MDTSRLRRRTAVPFLLALLVLLGACSSGGSTDQGADTRSAEVESADTGAAAREAPAPAANDLDAAAVDGAFPTGAQDAPEEVDESGDRAIISTGVISLLDKDVAGARFDVQKIVDTHGGEVAEEKTRTDDDGAISQSRLVVRVPAAEFDVTMEELEEVAELESSNRSSEDVTTTVIDNEVRIRAQTESLRRIETLLARARTIRDIVNIESQLTRRQADLDSLKQQQAYLADQTSLSTITVFLEQKPEPTKKKVEAEDAAGFLAGLSSGWGALKTLTTGVTTVVGALLPFTLLLLLVGVPAWLLLRRRVSAGRTGRTPSAA